MPDTPTLYVELKSDVEAIALALFDMSQHLLRENGNFLPHAAVLLESGEIRHVGATTNSEDGTSISTEMLPLLHSGLREMVKAEPIKAVGVAENVTVTMSGEPATAATKVLFEHIRGLTVALYEPFDELPDQRYVYGNIFTKEAEPEVQAWHRRDA
ncbi:MAG: hypothetical protein ABIZ18_08460 [Caldimonas sp.]